MRLRTLLDREQLGYERAGVWRFRGVTTGTRRPLQRPEGKRRAQRIRRLSARRRGGRPWGSGLRLPLDLTTGRGRPMIPPPPPLAPWRETGSPREAR